ncbi:hypothetical protein [Paenibacillus oleatilyticus]|uniref:hypothetical protein n=1 Tax=Paenibacillus oleatilyticus TaxID=2594886 RepID=UPI0020A7E82B|nr:hypothetical protein [Paenibacillus oleatilyticus]
MPAVLEAPIAFELKLDRISPVGGDHLVLGIVQRVQVDSAAYAGNYKTETERWKPLASMAGDYAGLTSAFSFDPGNQE